jgi:hypothetical protein
VRGHATFEVAGDRVDAPTGAFIFAPPGIDRTAVAEEGGTTVLALEGTPGKAYDPRGWELWAPLVPLYEAHEYRKVAERLRALVETSPQYGMLFYNLACCESQAGCTAQAVAHLRRAIGMGGEWRESARADPDFDPIRNESEFQQLIGG